MKLTNNKKAILLVLFSVFLMLGIIVLIKLLNTRKRDKNCIPKTTCTSSGDCSNGSDGCKGTCTCPDHQQCVNGNCVIVDCIPKTTCTSSGDCSNGSDGCKGTCTCPDPQKCVNGNCVCIPTTTCTGYNCSVGSDGCTGTCTCPDSQQCVKGSCSNPLIQNMFVAVGNPYTFYHQNKQFTSTMVTSTDGINWEPIPDTLFSNFAAGIACNGLIWVAVGLSNDFSIAWSPDGKNWIKADNYYMNIIFSQGGIGVKWNGNLWVAVGSGDYSIAWSLDGKYWNGVKDSNNILSKGRGVSSPDGKTWLAVGEGNGTYSIAISQDGKIWKGVEDSGKLFISANAIACNGKTCIAVGDITDGKTSNSIAWSTASGFTWKSVDNRVNIFSKGNDVLWTGNTWIAVGASVKLYGTGHPIAISPNGNDWTYITYFSGDSIQSIGSNENFWVFSTSNGIITSKDLTSFTLIKNILTNGVLRISWW